MILFLLAAAAAQPQSASPKAFMERLYANYRQTDYSPFKHPERVFSPRLAAALAEDSHLFKNEVGYVDADPVCQCQDADGVTGNVEKITSQGAGRAAARVMIGFTDSTPRRVTFSLVRTAGGWRIDDVSSPDEPSFLKGLEASNRKARAKH
jgi:hypothetical protein